jgi:hypothetical protein
LGGTETDEFEEWMAREIETPAEGSIAKATANKPLTQDDWECLTRFLAAQDVRTPARMMEFLARQASELPATIEQVLKNAVSELTEAKRTGQKVECPAGDMATGFPSRVTTEIEPGAETGTLKLETVVGRSLWIWSLKRLLTQTYRVLRVHKWTIVRPPVGMNWITSDNPVVKLNYYADGRYDFKGGWSKEGGEILMPLGPQHLICTHIGGRTPWIKGERVRKSVALMLQKFTIENAHRYVYTVAPDPLVERIRPRLVNAAAFESEAKQWKRWGKEQSEAEHDLNNPADTRHKVSPG